MEKMKKMLRFLEIPYTVIGPFEIDIEEGALNEKNKAWFEERLNNEFNKFSTQKGIAKRKISDFKHDTSGNIRGKASK